MKRIETSRIRNGQWLLARANPAELLATDEWQSTLTDHHSQTGGQEIWPDCFD